MPTKAGLIKPSDIRHGLTVWRVSQVTDGHGVVSRQYCDRLFCISRVTPVPCFMIVGKDTEVNYIDQMAWFQLETGGIMSIESSDMGHDVPGAYKHMPFHNYLFSSEKAALRFANEKNGFHKPSKEEIQFARDHSDYCDEHEGKAPTQWTPLPDDYARIPDRRRYLRIPGRGICSVIVRENGDLVYRERSNFSKSSNKMLSALAKRMAEGNVQTDIVVKALPSTGIQPKVLARLPAKKVENRTARKKAQRTARGLIEEFVHRAPVKMVFSEALHNYPKTLEERRELANKQVIVPTARNWAPDRYGHWAPFVNAKAAFIMRGPRDVEPLSHPRPTEPLSPIDPLVSTTRARMTDLAVKELLKQFPAVPLVLKGSEDRNTHMEGNEDVN